MQASRATLTTTVAQRLCLTLLAPLVHSVVRRALRVVALGDEGFIPASGPEPPEPSCRLASAASVGEREAASASSTQVSIETF